MLFLKNKFSDTPFALALAALESIPVLTGTQNFGFNFSIYTGDLVSHDPDNQLSREYVEYTEVSQNGLLLLRRKKSLIEFC
jgi:sphingomyelin phosphodiesterase